MTTSKTTKRTTTERHYSKAAQARCSHTTTIGMGHYAVCIQCEAILETEAAS
jgi:hypothetical protein